MVSAPPAAPRVREVLEEARAPAKEAAGAVAALEAAAEGAQAMEAVVVPEAEEEVVVAAVVVPEAAEEDNLQNKMCKKKG